MPPAASLEAQEALARRALAAGHAALRARLAGEPPPPGVVPDTRGLAVDALAMRPLDPARAALLAEAFAAGVVRPAWERYEVARAAKPVRLRAEEAPVALDDLASVVATEPSAPRRAALVAAGDVAAADTRDEARDVVAALRAAGAALDDADLAGLGVGLDAATFAAVLAATDEVHRELDAWACRALDLDPLQLTWADRLRSLAAPAVAEAVAPSAWAGVGARWMERVGLGDALRAVTSELAPAARAARGVVVLGIAPVTAGGGGALRAVLAGRASVAGTGALDVAGALGEALAWVAGRGDHAAARIGADRAVFGLAGALGRRLWLDRHFLKREAGLDAAPRERVMLGALHGEVVRTRLDAALGRFAALALTRAGDLGERFQQDVTRAVGAAPTPAWAVHLAARALAARWGSRAVGGVAEPALRQWLRERYDEDWFRNPRAGEGLAGALQDARTGGVREWCKATGATGETPGADALGPRFAEEWREARRTTG